jgi:hypothetical protein
MKLIYLLVMLIANVVTHGPDLQKTIQCLICEDMFQKGFNYEEFMKDASAIDKIKNRLSGNFDMNVLSTTLNKDNLEFVTKEISMQYFFKGAESQFDENTSKQIKLCNENNAQQQCEKVKLGLCENILSFESGLCTYINSSPIRPVNDNKVVDSPGIANHTALPNNIQQMQDTFSQQSQGNNMHSFHSNKAANQFMNSNMYTNAFNPAMLGAAGYPPYMMNNGMASMVNMQALPLTPDNISLLQVSQKYLENNNAIDDSKQKQWNAPKPVLLDNFQSNIGDQLKDISLLTT